MMRFGFSRGYLVYLSYYFSVRGLCSPVLYSVIFPSEFLSGWFSGFGFSPVFSGGFFRCLLTSSISGGSLWSGWSSVFVFSSSFV